MKSDLIAERAAYNVLKKVFCDRAYSSIELDRALDNAPPQYRSRITALVYGVLEKSVLLDHVLASLAKNKVKNNIEILLKMGLFELRFGADPDHAVVNRYVDLAKNRFPGTQGFVNAVLRHAQEIELPSGNAAPSLSVRCSQPLWLVESLLVAYGHEKTQAVLAAELPKATHIRHNASRVTVNDFVSQIAKVDENEALMPTKLGYYVSHSVLRALDPTLFTPQSLASMYAVRIYAEDFVGKSPAVLDLCAAPGGKSVYFKELVPAADITACDVHEHRVSLIRAYAARMGAEMRAEVNDATQARNAWIDKFDAVICDVPCTGSGLLISSPDILLFKTAADVKALADLQYRILSVAARYVKVGGELLYSTCSILPDENEQVVDRFLADSDNFSTVDTALPYGRTENGKTKLFPDTDGCDGFFIAKMRRLK